MSGSGSDEGSSLHDALRALASQARELDHRLEDDPDTEAVEQAEALGDRLRELLPGRLVNPVLEANSTWVDSEAGDSDSGSTLHSLTSLGGRPGPASIADAIERFLADTSGVDLGAAAERYEDDGELGHGGMGDVLRVYDRRLQRHVAMKVLRDQGGRSDLVARFAQEARVTGQLEHPGIVPVHDMGRTAEGALYFTMKQVRGRSFGDVIFQTHQEVQAGTLDRGLALVRLLDSLLKVCNAVAFAHSRGVVHRDLKPDNVMVGEFGEVQVMDWGLAKIIGSQEDDRGEGISGGEAHLSRVGAVTGTPAYMAPEQARGELDRIGPHTDVWALGATLYEILVGEQAFQGEVESILEAVRVAEVVPPSQRRGVPRELEAIVLRAMAPEPEDRYADVGALAADLRAWLQGRPLDSLAYTPTELARKWVKRNRATVTGALVTAALSLALIVGGAIKYLVDLDSALDLAEAEAQHAHAAEAEARVTLAHSRVATADALSANGRYTEARDLYRQATTELRELHQPDLGPRLGLWTVYHRTRAPLGPFAPSVGEIRRVVPRPDGEGALVMGMGSTLAEVELPTGRVNAWWEAGDPPIEVRWEPTGPVAWVLRDEGPVLRLVRDDLGRGEATPLFALPLEHRDLRPVQGTDEWLVTDGRVTWRMRPVEGDWEQVELGRGTPVWAQGDRAILAAPQGETWLWDLSAGKRVRRISPHYARVGVSPDASLVAVGEEATRQVAVLELDTGRELWRAATRNPARLVFDSSGEHVLVATSEPGTDVYEVRTGRLLSRLEGHASATQDIEGFGELVVTVGAEGDALLWATPTEVPRGEVFQRTARDADLSQDGSMVALAAHDHVELWDAHVGRFLAAFPTHRQDAWAVFFSPGSSRVLATYREDTPVLVELPSGEPRAIPVGGVLAADFVDERRVLLGTSDGRVLLWDCEEMEALWSQPRAHSGVVWSVRHQGQRVWSAGFEDGRLASWDLDSGEPVADRQLEGVLYQPVPSQDGQLVSQGSYARTVFVLPADGGEPVATLDQHEGPVLDQAFSPDGRWLATGEWNWKLRFFDTTTWEQLSLDTEHQGPIGDVWWPTPDEVLSYGDDGRLLRRELDLDTELSYAAFQLEQVGRGSGPLTAEDHLALAEVFALHGAWSLAARCWEHARELGSDTPALREARAWWMAGQPAAALERLPEGEPSPYDELLRARLGEDARFE